MTPEEFDKIVKDYAENGLPEDSALIFIYGGKTFFGSVYGKSVYLAASIAMAMFENKGFANMVKLACDVYDAEVGPEKAEAAETVSKYLDRMGFKKEE